MIFIYLFIYLFIHLIILFIYLFIYLFCVASFKNYVYFGEDNAYFIILNV